MTLDLFRDPKITKHSTQPTTMRPVQWSITNARIIFYILEAQDNGANSVPRGSGQADGNERQIDVRVGNSMQQQ